VLLCLLSPPLPPKKEKRGGERGKDRG